MTDSSTFHTQALPLVRILLALKALPSLLFLACCHFSPARCLETPWTVPHQAPLSMGFSRQEYWSVLPFPLPGDVPGPGMASTSLMSPALTGRFFTTSTIWEALAGGLGVLNKHPPNLILSHIAEKWLKKFLTSDP